MIGDEKSHLLTSAASSADLLSTKITPPRLQAELIARPALYRRLDQGLDWRLTLVSAPPGSGKTTLVRQWVDVRAGGGATAWVSLDAGDNDPVRFWRYLLAACRVFGVEIVASGLEGPIPPRPSVLESMLTMLINACAALPGKQVLVIEDYHLIEEAQIHSGVAFLLEHLPPTLHIVLLTRTEPPLPLARLRARNDVHDVTAADLRFSAGDTRAFLETALAFPVSDESLSALERRTEGWIAALRLVVLAVQRQHDITQAEHFLTTFSGSQRHILDYLTAEVLAAQPETMQAFLLRVACLGAVTGPLCDAVTGRDDSALMLEVLDRANLFITPLDGEQQWYRFHTLFAEAMRHEAQRRLGVDAVRALFERASHWYSAHDLPREAIESALEAHAWELAAQLITQTDVDNRLYSETHSFARWAAQVPEAVLTRYPTAAFIYARALVYTTDRHAPDTMARVQWLLRLAEDDWRATGQDEKLGELLAFRALTLWWLEDYGPAFAMANEADRLLSQDNLIWYGTNLLNLVGEALFSGQLDRGEALVIQAQQVLKQTPHNTYAMLASLYLQVQIYLSGGDLTRAAALSEHIRVQAATSPAFIDDSGNAHIGLATVALERNDLEQARVNAETALAIGALPEEEGILIEATILLARLDLARGDPKAGRARLEVLMAEPRRPVVVRQVTAWQMWLAQRDGDLRSVERWLTTVTPTEGELPHELRTLEAVLLARLWTAQGKPAAALDWLARWRTDAERLGQRRGVLWLMLAQLDAYNALGDEAQAVATLRDSMLLAQATGLRRLLLDEGASLFARLARLLHNLPEETRLFARELCAPPGIAAVVMEGDAFAALSRQERRVLRLLAAGMSNPEIADELVVSVNTVKTQLKSIFRKLDVTNRDDAGDVARRGRLG